MSEDSSAAQEQQIKLGSLFGIFAIGLICAYLPFLVRKKAKDQSSSERFLSMANALAGGVVLGAAFNHMLPAARESFAAWTGSEGFPYAETVAIFAVLILLFIDSVFLSAMGHGHDHQPGLGHSHDISIIYNSKLSESAPILIPSGKKEADHNVQLNTLPNHAYTMSDLLSVDSCHKHSDESKDQVESHDEESAVASKTFKSHAQVTQVGSNQSDGEASKTETASPFASNRALMSKAYLFVFALSIHSFLEGTGLGSENEPDRLLSILAAVLAHKGLEAFALGSSILAGGFTKWSSFALILFYAVTTPIGIAIGMAIAAGLEGNATSAFLVSAAAGSFIYISLVELIPRELSHRTGKVAKMALVLLGWGIMAMIAIWA